MTSVVLYLALYGLALAIIVLFLLRNRPKIYDPYVIILPYLLFMALDGIYRVRYGFEGIRAVSFIQSIEKDIVLESFIYFSISTILLFFPFCFIFSNEKVTSIKPFPVSRKSNVYFLILSFLLIPVINFSYIVFSSAGSFLEYYSNIGYYAFMVKEKNLSQLGYIFLYPAMVLAIASFCNGTISKKYLISLSLVVFFIVLSKARITHLVTDLLFFYIIYSRLNKSYINTKVMLLAGVIGFLGLSFFGLRYGLDLIRVGLISPEDGVSEALSLISSKLINEGNLPGYSSFFAIYNSYGDIIEYRYGETLFNLLQPIFPNAVFANFDTRPISVEFKEALFASEAGRGFPPSIFGEFYANFGSFGLLIMSLALSSMFFLLRLLINRTRSLYTTVFIAVLLSKFVFILPKGELSRFSAIQIAIIVTVCLLVVQVIFNRSYKN